MVLHDGTFVVDSEIVSVSPITMNLLHGASYVVNTVAGPVTVRHPIFGEVPTLDQLKKVMKTEAGNREYAEKCRDSESAAAESRGEIIRKLTYKSVY